MHRPFPSSPQTSYRVEVDPRGQRLVIPIRIGWKAVSMAVIATLAGSALHVGKLFDDISLFGWLVKAAFGLGLLAMLINALTSLFAREFVQIGHGELVHGWRLLGLRRQKSYRASEIWGLTSLNASEDDPKTKKRLISPLSDFGKTGLIRFEAGTTTVHIGPTLTEPEADEIATWLARRLPRGAAET